MRAVILGVALILSSGCSRSNNLLLGRVEAVVGSHTVVVTDCYRASVPPPQRLENMPDGQAVYRFMPCKDADVAIRGEELAVNGKDEVSMLAASFNRMYRSLMKAIKMLETE